MSCSGCPEPLCRGRTYPQREGSCKTQLQLTAGWSTFGEHGFKSLILKLPPHLWHQEIMEAEREAGAEGDRSAQCGPPTPEIVLLSPKASCSSAGGAEPWLRAPPSAALRLAWRCPFSWHRASSWLRVWEERLARALQASHPLAPAELRGREPTEARCSPTPFGRRRVRLKGIFHRALLSASSDPFEGLCRAASRSDLPRPLRCAHRDLPSKR